MHVSFPLFLSQCSFLTCAKLLENVTQCLHSIHATFIEERDREKEEKEERQTIREREMRERERESE